MRRCLAFATFAFAALLAVSEVQATQFFFQADLDGPSEAPPNASPGTGKGFFTYDDVALTLRVEFFFQDLIGTTTAAHIHGPTAAAGTGTAGVMTTTPTFVGTPLGVTSGHYVGTLDLTLASSYNAAFLNNATNGGSIATARATMIDAIKDGKSYLNIHTTQFPAGEIRGFLRPVPEPGTLGLLAVGALGLAAARRKRLI